MANLETLHEMLAETELEIEIGWRTYKSFDASLHAEDYDLSRLLVDIRDTHDIPLHINSHYDNWGGIITGEDVQGLDIEIDEGQWIPNFGACSLIFYKLQVMADGRVNACACRDVNATLQIGDLSSQPLSFILSAENQTYMDLIESQQRAGLCGLTRKMRGLEIL